MKLLGFVVLSLSIFYFCECHFNNNLLRTIYFAFLEVEKSLGLSLSWDRIVWASKMGQDKMPMHISSSFKVLLHFLTSAVYSNLINLYLFCGYKLNYFTVYIFKYILMRRMSVANHYLLFLFIILFFFLLLFLPIFLLSFL